MSHICTFANVRLGFQKKSGFRVLPIYMVISNSLTSEYCWLFWRSSLIMEFLTSAGINDILVISIFLWRKICKWWWKLLNDRKNRTFTNNAWIDVATLCIIFINTLVAITDPGSKTFFSLRYFKKSNWLNVFNPKVI